MFSSTEQGDSLRKHLWGRAISRGSLTLKAEKDIGMKSEGSTGTKEIMFLNDPMRVSGEGCSLMLEWSKPTEVTLARALRHMKQEYKFSGIPSRTSDGDRNKQDLLIFLDNFDVGRYVLLRRVGLYTELFYAIIPTLFLCFLLICYPYILLHF